MDYFILYDVTTGEEFGRLSGPAGSAQLQPLGLTRGVVMIPAEDYADQVPLEEISIEDLRQSLWNFTKIIKSQMLVRGAQTNWGIVDSDAQSILNLQIKLMSIDPGSAGPQDLTLKNNLIITLDAVDMIQLIRQAMAFLDGIHAHARALRTALEQVQDNQSLLKVDVFRGWPAFSKENES